MASKPINMESYEHQNVTADSEIQESSGKSNDNTEDDNKTDLSGNEKNLGKSLNNTNSELPVNDLNNAISICTPQYLRALNLSAISIFGNDKKEAAKTQHFENKIIKKEQEDKDHQEMLSTMEIEEVLEIKVEPYTSLQIGLNSINTKESEEIFYKNDDNILSDSVLKISKRKSRKPVAIRSFEMSSEDCTETSMEYYPSTSEIEAYQMSLREPFENSERSIFNAKENPEVILSTNDSDTYNSNLLKASKSQAGKLSHKYQCGKCFATFKTSATRIRHMKAHYKRERQQKSHRTIYVPKTITDIKGFPHFKCEKCNKMYICGTSLEKHMLKCRGLSPVQLPIERDIGCDVKTRICGEITIKSDDSEKMPIKDEFSDDITPTECPELLIIRDNMLKLQQQSIEISKNPLNETGITYSCPTCCRLINGTTLFKRHLVKHLKDTKQRLGSTKAQITKRNLKDMRGREDLKCPNCYKQYSFVTSLERHMRFCQVKVKDEPLDYVCTCKKTYTTESDMQKCFKKHNVKPADTCQVKLNKDPQTALLNYIRALERDMHDLIGKVAIVSETQNDYYECPKCVMTHTAVRPHVGHLNFHIGLMKLQLKKKKAQFKKMAIKSKAGCTELACNNCNNTYTVQDDYINHIIACGKIEVEINSENLRSEEKQPIENQETHHVSDLKDLDKCASDENMIETNATASLSKEFQIENVTCALKNTKDKKNDESISEETPCQFEPKVGIEEQNPNSKKMKLDVDDKGDLKIKFDVVTVKRVKDVNGVTRYKCNQCSKIYSTNESLSVHINAIHNPNDAPPEITEEYPCFCGKVFSRKSRMEACSKQHIQKEWQEKKLPHCSSCKYYFDNQDELELHKRVAHTEERFLCKLCPIEYSTPFELFDHLKLHQIVQYTEHKIVEENTEENYNFKCFICERVHTELADLNFHFLNDHNEPYTCKICNEIFYEIDDFLFHTKTLHLPSEEQLVIQFLEAFSKLVRSWKCQPCQFECKNPDILAEHVQNHRTMNALKFDPFRRKVIDVCKVRCAHCRRLFKAKTGLDDHMQMYHSSSDLSSTLVNQDFSLKVCNFNRKDSVPQVRNFTNTCFLCKIQFVSEPNLKCHMLSQKHIDIKSYLLNEQFFRENTLGESIESTVPKTFETVLVKQEIVDEIE